VITVVPAEIPANTPEPEIVATTVLLLVQLPPDVASNRFVPAPAHAVVKPVMGAMAKALIEKNNPIAIR